jgi:hypothetical protein
MVNEAMCRLDPVRLACSLLLLGPLLVPTAGCVVVQEAEAGILVDAVPADFEEPDGSIVECFHNKLPDGDWEERKPFGKVWTPHVPKDWAPYTDGHWVETNQGWGWVTVESWGWAVYHYGRWSYAAEHKWFWVPGTRWAPAWVAWRSGNGYIGWAPLPPAIGFDVSSGLDPGAAAISATHFYFIPERALLSPDLRNVVLPAAQNAAIFQKTSDITHYKMVHQRIFDLGISPRYIAGIVGQRPQRLSVASLAESAGAAGKPGPFYQPPALAQLASRSPRELGSTSNSRQAAGPGAEAAGDRQATRGAGTMAPSARAGRHASIAANAGSTGRGTLRSGHRLSFGAPSARNQAGRATSRQAETVQATRPAAGTFGFQPRQPTPSRTVAAQPQPSRGATPQQPTPSWAPRSQPQPPGGSQAAPPQRATWAAAPPPRFPGTTPPPSQRPAPPAHAPARMPSGGGHRPP